jgi:hypothetical protein
MFADVVENTNWKTSVQMEEHWEAAQENSHQKTFFDYRQIDLVALAEAPSTE